MKRQEKKQVKVPSKKQRLGRSPLGEKIKTAPVSVPVSTGVRAEDSPAVTLKQGITNLIESAANLRDQITYFKNAYGAAVREIGAPAARGILATVNHNYLSGPAKFLPTWQIFLKFLEHEKFEITFPH